MGQLSIKNLIGSNGFWLPIENFIGQPINLTLYGQSFIGTVMHLKIWEKNQQLKRDDMLQICTGKIK